MDDRQALKVIDTALRHITGFRKLEPQLRVLRQQLLDREKAAARDSVQAFAAPVGKRA